MTSRSHAPSFAATLLAGAAVLSCASAALAQEKLKIGLVVTLSGPSAVLGGQIRDGFALALKDRGGKFGGLETEVIVIDDELKPDVAVQKVKGLLERDKATFVVGPVFSNVLQAIHKPVVETGGILISPNAGTSNFAGKQCNPNFFVTSYQNDQIHEVLGKYAQDKGYKRVVLMAPNYQAGKDALAGFKRHFKGEVADEMFTPLGQLDFSAELAKIAAARPDAFFTFMPGGMGVNLVKQYRLQQSLANVPFLSAFTTDESTLPAQKDDAVGFLSGANWAPDFKNPQSEAFVKAYEAAYNSVPGTYAMQAYDAGQLIDSAIKATGGKLDRTALEAALKKADFKSLRGDFKFGANNYPIQNFYLTKVAKRPDGKYQTEIAQMIFSDYRDAYAPECPMK